jgi:hypothetical protein
LQTHPFGGAGNDAQVLLIGSTHRSRKIGSPATRFNGKNVNVVSSGLPAATLRFPCR